jgi:PKD domain/Secretion system C-terminal sorting domain
MLIKILTKNHKPPRSMKKSIYGRISSMVLFALTVTAIGFAVQQGRIATLSTPVATGTVAASVSTPNSVVSETDPSIANAQTQTEQYVAKAVEPSMVASVPSNETEAATNSYFFKKRSKAERINDAMEMEKERTMDPALGYIPYERKLAALEQTLRRQQTLMQNGTFSRGAISRARWTNRGPNNVGGRSRAILVDLNDSTRKSVFVAAATGGLWKTKDVTAVKPVWQLVDDWSAALAISSIVQDPSNPQIMYLGTGDVAASDAPGKGVMKSTDGGKNWTLLASTTTGGFNRCSALSINPANGNVFVSTLDNGLNRSSDGGATWVKVLGAGVPGFAANTNWRVQQVGNTIYSATSTNVYKSTSNGDAGTWTGLYTINNGFPTGFSRMEMGVAPSDANVIYIVGNQGGTGSAVYKTADGGVTWRATPRLSWRDGGGAPSTADFTRGQAWYDLSLAVSPTNPNVVYVGGVDLFRTIDGGTSWAQVSSWTSVNYPYVHADQHGFAFEPGNGSVGYVGCDGGLFRVNNAETNYSYGDKNEGYVTALFYAGAIHPTAGTNYFLAGAQDNGSIQIKTGGIAPSRRVLGGDGFYCFINQNNPNYQIVSLYNGAFSLSKDAGETWSGGTNSGGKFLTPSDLDNATNIFYAQKNSADLWRWNLATGIAGAVDVSNVTFSNGTSSNISHIGSDPNTPNRIYVGTTGGQLYKIDNANTGATVTAVAVGGAFGGNVSSIDVERGNPNHLLLTVSSYGARNSVWESRDGGNVWVGVKGINIPNNLPDMPVRWGLFSPNNPNQAMIATDFGVWTTESLNGDNTSWLPPVPGRGTPLVRTDMLRLRQSDKIVLGATYGRGLWTTGVFSTPSVSASYPQVGYKGGAMEFKGENSNSAETFLWTFGDGGTDTLENPKHAYANVGTYNVSLKVNNDNTLVSNGSVEILPDLPTAYKASTAGYQGHFDGADTHFGVNHVSGSKFERGRSAINGKDGTHSGANAYVVGLTEAAVQPNTTTMLYLPNYDFSQAGIYEFSFWAKYICQNGYDGFNIEYSYDKGLNWIQLGSSADPDWYPKNQIVPDNAPFLQGQNYFTNVNNDWTKFKLNVSRFSGQKNVAFRVVFKSGSTSPLAGMAIDDIEITKYEGDSKTQIVELTGAFARTGVSIDVKWATLPEYYAQRFTLEMSENGWKFDSIANINATGYLTLDKQTYTKNVGGAVRDVYYFRIKSVNRDAALNYNYTFYSPTIIVKRDGLLGLEVNKVAPNPFIDKLFISFTDVVGKSVQFRLIDAVGRVVIDQTEEVGGVNYILQTGRLAQGMYLLNVKIDGKDAQTFKVMSSMD